MYLSPEEHPVDSGNEQTPILVAQEADDLAGALLTHVSEVYATEERARRRERTELMIARAAARDS